MFLVVGFGHRSYAVVGCPKSGKTLNKWSSSMCKGHECIREKDGCDCEPPFKLFPFPTERKNNEARILWAKVINGQNPKLCFPETKIGFTALACYQFISQTSLAL